MSPRTPSTLIFFDTSALIPFLVDSDPLHPRLVHSLRSSPHHYVIDTIVLAEYLAKIPTADYASVLARFQKTFRIQPFSELSAQLFAELFKVLDAHGHIPRTPTGRQVVKADLMVLSSAIASGVSEFYFDDRGFSSWSAFLPLTFLGLPLPHFVCLSNLPPAPVQGVIPLPPSPPSP